MAVKHNIIPHLWFDQNAEAAVNFYLSIFGDLMTMKKIDIKGMEDAFAGIVSRP
jgi:predicted 3-demethylubiquinone-9 3-methyltransferase (glyoxalase superfamily)